MRNLFFIGSLFISLPCIAQEKEESFTRHSIGLVISHAQTFEGRDEEGNRKTLALPCWGIDYNFHFNPKWAMGLHTDIIIEKFLIEETGSGELSERSYPVAPALMGMYKMTEHWQAQLGSGVECASEGNIFLIRAGVEYGVELPGAWEVFGSLSFDMKWDTYETLTLGLGIAKNLKRK